jgi:hypothetical protein
MICVPKRASALARLTPFPDDGNSFNFPQATCLRRSASVRRTISGNADPGKFLLNLF